MSENLVKKSTFVSFDGAIKMSSYHQRPDRYRHLEINYGKQLRIARGGGYSFSAASFGENVLVQELTNFDRFLDFDETLKVIKVEAGMPLGKMLDWIMERGLYFPVLPGYPNITVGGCVAVDAHGKNPWKDGTFSEWVIEINLFHPFHGYMSLSREEHSDEFELTCGGFGTTGIIVDVTLQLVDLPSNALEVRKIPVRSLDEAMRKLSENADDSDYIYSWHGGSQNLKNFGAGVIFIGKWLQDGNTNVDSRLRRKVMTAQSRTNLPISFWNRFTVGFANRLFTELCTVNSREIMGVCRATFPFAYGAPYHSLFGRRGFSEIQVLIDLSTADIFIQKLCHLLEKHNPPLLMVSMKAFRGEQRSLSMAGEGYLVALNFYRNDKLPEFLELVDQLILETNAQPNLSKDSRCPYGVASRTLPHYSHFQTRLHQFDPYRLYRSELTERLGI